MPTVSGPPSTRNSSAGAPSRAPGSGVSGDHPVPAPDVAGVQRHLLDESQAVAVVEAELQQVGRLVLIEPAHQHGVDLDRGQSGGSGRGQRGQHVRQPPAAGQPLEGVRVQRVQRDVDPVEAGLGELAGAAGEPDPVGGHGDLRARPQRRDPGDDLRQTLAQQRFSAGEADLPDAQPLHRDGDHPHQLVVGEQLVGGLPGQALRGHAVRAAQIAPVGQRHAQVRRPASVPIDQERRLAPVTRVDRRGRAGSTHAWDTQGNRGHSATLVALTSAGIGLRPAEVAVAEPVPSIDLPYSDPDPANAGPNVANRSP